MLEEIIHAHLTESFLEKAAELARSYFRIEVEGLQHIPSTGRALVIPNHSGFAAADALMITHLIHKECGRMPKILAHRAFFDWFEALRRASLAFGLEKVSIKRGVELLKNDELVLLFPEGESGNFKPTHQRYHLQRFHSGFIRMAIEARAPLVPCLVIGAEESQLNLGSVDASRLLKGLRLPVPLSLIPLPSKWKIRFLEPVQVDEHMQVADLTTEIQVKMQRALNHELGQRKTVFF